MVVAHRLGTALGLFALIAAACASGSVVAEAQNSQEPAAEAPAAPADPALTAAIEAGQKEYMKNCRTCHGSKGTAGVPLAKNEKVSDNPGYLIWAILTGPGYMPEFAPVLSDEQIALITTFVQNSWGNSYGMVTPEDVKMSR